jgi:hypothetical protein
VKSTGGYKVKIVIGDATVEVEGAETGVVKIVEAVSDVLCGSRKPSSSFLAETNLSPPAIHSSSARSTAVDIRSFFEAKAPSSGRRRILRNEASPSVLPAEVLRFVLWLLSFSMFAVGLWLFCTRRVLRPEAQLEKTRGGQQTGECTPTDIHNYIGWQQGGRSKTMDTSLEIVDVDGD